MPPRDPGLPELRRLATWPRRVRDVHARAGGSHDGRDRQALDLRLPGDGRKEYLRNLLSWLLDRHNRLIVETVVVVRFDGAPYFTSQVRVRPSNAPSVTAYGAGANPADARLNGELLALRATVLGGRIIPVLGRLFSVGPISVDLDCEDETLKTYHLTIKVMPEVLDDPALDPRGWFKGQTTGSTLIIPPRLEAEHRLRVTYAPGEKRTRYLKILGLHEFPALHAIVGPFMRTETSRGEVYLHRFIAALGHRVISRDKRFAAVADAGSETFDDEHLAAVAARFGHDLKVSTNLAGRDLHVHHINGAGDDDRLENLQPLTEEEHEKLHRAWVGDYNSFERPDFHAWDPGQQRLWMPPPRIISRVDHYDLVLRSGELDHPDGLPAAGLIAPWTAPQPPQLTRTAAAPPLTPLTSSELARLAGRHDRRVSWLKVFAGLVDQGGQGRAVDLKLERSSGWPHPRTIRDNLKAMAEAGILRATKLASDENQGARGTLTHYRLIWQLADDLAAEVDEVLHALGTGRQG